MLVKTAQEVLRSQGTALGTRSWLLQLGWHMLCCCWRQQQLLAWLAAAPAAASPAAEPRQPLLLFGVGWHQLLQQVLCSGKLLLYQMCWYGGLCGCFVQPLLLSVVLSCQCSVQPAAPGAAAAAVRCKLHSCTCHLLLLLQQLACLLLPDHQAAALRTQKHRCHLYTMPLVPALPAHACWDCCCCSSSSILPAAALAVLQAAGNNICCCSSSSTCHCKQLHTCQVWYAFAAGGRVVL